MTESEERLYSLARATAGLTTAMEGLRTALVSGDEELDANTREALRLAAIAQQRAFSLLDSGEEPSLIKKWEAEK